MPRRGGGHGILERPRGGEKKEEKKEEEEDKEEKEEQGEEEESNKPILKGGEQLRRSDLQTHNPTPFKVPTHFSNKKYPPDPGPSGFETATTEERGGQWWAGGGGGQQWLRR